MNIKPLLAVHIGSMLMAALLTGCGVPPLREMPNDPQFAPQAPNQARADFAGQGAITYARFGNSLFSDRRAMEVGDILTIVLSEKTAATKDAATDVEKNNEIQLGGGPIMGNSDPHVGGINLDTDVTHDRKFKGDAQSSQSNSLNGSIAVSVTEILPNGILRVRGEKWLRLNRGDEYIRLTGMVRQEDIAPDNSVSSTKLADARISYSGTGELAESSHMGWLSRFFNSSWWPL